MTPKQTEKLRTKIADIKRVLAMEKRKFGGYDDSRGLRYLPTKYFLQLGDYSGGLTFTKWFTKNFPDDSGFPDFLFEWTIILFKTRKTLEAEQKAFQTFCSNTYLFDKFFGRPITPIDKWEGSNLAAPAFTEHFEYSSGDPGLSDFSEWLDKYVLTEKFCEMSDKYIDIYKKLKDENNVKRRHYLVELAGQIEQSA